MKAIRTRFVFIAAMLTIVAAAIGCRQQSDAAKSEAASRAAKPGPEESFQLIVETFRRGVEDVQIGFVSRDSEGHSMMTGKNEVTHRLIPPAKEGEPYKAVITVGSQSRYSIQRPTNEDDEEAGEQRSDSFAEEGTENGLQVFDPDLVGPSGDTNKSRRTPPAPTENSELTVTRQADQQKRNYELVYEDGKWVLVTSLDPETEQSIENAFRRALDTQI